VILVTQPVAKPTPRQQWPNLLRIAASLLVATAIMLFVAQGVLFPRQSGHFPLSEAWVYQANGRIVAVSTSASGIVFARTNADLTALAADSGQSLWQVELPRQVQPSPVIARDGAALVGAATREVWALDELTGQVLWKIELEPPLYGEPHVLGVTPCCVLVSRLAPDLTAYDPIDGQTLWSLPNSRSFPTIHLDGETIYVTGAEGVQALEAATGKQLWSRDIGPVGSSAYQVGTIFVMLNSNRSGPRVVAFDVANKSFVWTAPIDDDPLVEVQALDGAVYVTSPTHLYAFQAATGRSLWQAQLSFGSNVRLVGQVVYVFDWLDQRIVAYDPNSGQELGAVQYAFPQLYFSYRSNVAQLPEWLFVAEGRKLHAFGPP
jgi:outer membrane protein assembly factor BamB